MNKIRGTFYRHITDKGVKKPCIVLCTEDSKYSEFFTGVIVRNDNHPHLVGQIHHDFYSDVFHRIATKVNFGKLQ